MISPIVFVFGVGHQSPTRYADPENKHQLLGEVKEEIWHQRLGERETHLPLMR